MSMDITAIMEASRHRYPFLLVDRVTHVVKGESAEGYKNVTINEPFFVGHFPEEPVMPGVLIIEAMAQLGSMMFEGGKGYLVSVDKAKFTTFVKPGDRLEIKADSIGRAGKFAKVKVEGFVDGKKAAQAVVQYYFA